jgi:hypothetical protein
MSPSLLGLGALPPIQLFKKNIRYCPQPTSVMQRPMSPSLLGLGVLVPLSHMGLFIYATPYYRAIYVRYIRYL